MNGTNRFRRMPTWVWAAALAALSIILKGSRRSSGLKESVVTLIFCLTALAWMAALAALILRVRERRGRFTLSMLLMLMTVIAAAMAWFLWADRLRTPH